MKLSLPAVAVLSVWFSGCSLMDDYQNRQAQTRQEKAHAEKRQSALAEHGQFRALPGWKKNTYRNKALLAEANSQNVAVEISLAEQRGLLLVHGAVAMDFPVATGKKSHPTPAGSYTVLAKEKDYHSNLYGKIVDAAGTVVVADADTRTDAIPEGGRFEGSTMPYWMRLTNSGVGLHVGYVPGRPASHGCVRLKPGTAKQLFALVKIGTPVVIAEHTPTLAKAGQ